MNVGKIDSASGNEPSVFDSFTSAVTNSYSSARRVVFGNEGSSRGTMSLMSLSYKTVLHFSICFGLGAFFMLLAFLFLPMVVIAPQKFTLLFTLGCISWIVGLGVLQGPGSLIAAMFKPDRVPFTAIYGVSLLGVFYSTLIAHSYIFTILFSGLQIFSLSAFIISYFPGGLKLLGLMKQYAVSRLRGESFLPI